MVLDTVLVSSLCNFRRFAKVVHSLDPRQTKVVHSLDPRQIGLERKWVGNPQHAGSSVVLSSQVASDVPSPWRPKTALRRSSSNFFPESPAGIQAVTGADWEGTIRAVILVLRFA